VCTKVPSKAQVSHIIISPQFSQYEACKKYGVRSDNINYNLGTILYANGSPLGEPDIPWNTFENAWACIQDRGDQLNQQYIAQGSVLTPPPTGAEVFAQCGWDSTGNLPAELVEYMDLEWEYGRSTEQMSIYAFPEYTFYDFQAVEEMVTDEEGLQKFLAGVLSEFCPAGEDDSRIHLETEVAKIEYDLSVEECDEHSLLDDCIKLTLTTGEEVFANYVVSTIPFGALQKYHSELIPAGFPGAAVIDKFQMANYHKTYLLFPEKFWDDAQFIVSGEDDEFTVIYEPKDISHPNWYFPGSTVVQAVMGGAGGDWASGKSAQEMAAYHKARLENMYDGVGEVQEVITNDWWNDPLVHGTWFQMGVDATAADYTTLIQPAGHLVFSGEHTCGRHYGFVQGAMLAGMRDGQRILGELGYASTPEERCEVPSSNNGVKNKKQSKAKKAFSK